MKKFLRNFFIITLFVGLSATGMSQTRVVLSDNVMITVNGSTNPSGEIVDDGDTTGNYSDGFYGMAIITANPGDTILLWGPYHIENSYDHLYVYDGYGATGTQLDHVMGTGTLVDTSYSGYMTVVFSSDGSVNYEGFRLYYEVRSCNCGNNIFSFTANELEPNSVTLNWQAVNTAGSFLLGYGGSSVPVSGGSYSVAGLVPNTDYTFTLVAAGDMGVAECMRSLTVHTPCFHALVSGLRPLCGMDTVTLTADTADSYWWSTGETTRSISVTDTGWLTLVAFTNGGCSDTLEVRLGSIRPDMELNLPGALCPGDTALVTVGIATGSSVRVIRGESTLSESSRIFLPDGQECPPHGCSYRSELEFSGFENNAHISDVNDIRYVMLNIEHSYIGDIYINITCPNSQSADILRFSGSGTSSCTSHIGAGSRGWQSGSNFSTSTYLGIPYDYEDNSYPCDSTATLNQPGIGWRYCWSNCTDAGFTYASGDGLIYRNANYNSYYATADSSDVAAGTHFYHPDDSFASLIGCPMNGTWYIEVIDGWGVDNGYIFGWELALNPDRLSRNEYVPTVAYADLEGAYAVRRSDTSFVVTAPYGLTSDTTITYTVLITDSLGCMFDTTITIRFNAASTSSFYDTVDENSLPVRFAGQAFYNDTTAYFHYPNSSGCDSVVVFNLHVNHNSYASFDTTLCATQLPIQWYHRIFYTAGTQYDTLANHLGSDSILTLTLHVVPTVHLDFYDTICSNASIAFEGTTYTAAGSYPHQFLSSQGCDSIRTLHLAVLNTSQGDTTVTACDQFVWHGTTFTDDIHITVAQYTLNTAGCDSSVTLHLTINHSDSVTITDTLCEGNSLSFAGQTLSATGTYSHTFISQQGCDSTVVLNLTVHPTTYGDYYDTCLENSLPHTYGGITAHGDTTATFTLANSRLCDSVVTYHLHVLRNSYAVFDTAFCDNILPLQWYHRIFYTAGTQYDTIANHLGADSLLTLSLTVLPTYHDTLQASVCTNSYYLFEGDTLTTAGYHTHTYTSQQGCDSLVTIALNLLPLTYGDTVADVCDQFLWHGNTYTSSDTVTIPQYALNSYGCDSSVTLYLTIRHSTDSNITAEACDIYNWFGTNYLVPPVIAPTHTLTNSVGCDSVLRLTHLVIHNTQHFYDFDTSCLSLLQNGYVWNDTLITGITTSAEYTLARTDRYGCDSIRHLMLTVYDNSASNVYDTIVQNQAASWQYHGVPLSTDTTLLVTLTNHYGCDSLVTYHLHVWQNVYTTIDTSICENRLGSFSWYSHAAADTIRHVLATTHGADSVLTLLLHTLPTYQIDIYDTICDDGSTIFAGQELTVGGDYDHTFTSSLGCDSVVTLHLTVNPTYSLHLYDTIYVGDTIVFDGNTFVQPGDYPIHYQSLVGCDSLVTLHITGRNLLTASRTDSVCEGDTFYFCGRPLVESGVYYDTVYSGDFFAGDTIVELTLVVVPIPELAIKRTFECDPPAHYVLEGISNVSYLKWLGPSDIEGHEYDSIIAIPNPADTVVYTLYVDYRPEPLCPQTIDMELPPIPVINALIDVRPTALTLEERHLTASNASNGRVTSHTWYVFYNDDAPFTDTVRRLHLEVPMYVDSVAIALKVRNEMCSSSDTVHIEVLRADILFPNVFTPSLESNNYFRAYTTAVSEFELWIFDRRGALVFHTTDINQGWDGTHDGRPLPQAAYVYKCRYRDQITPNGYQNITGTVTLIR